MGSNHPSFTVGIPSGEEGGQIPCFSAKGMPVAGIWSEGVPQK